MAVWSSADALVIKCLTLYLENVLPVSRWCERLRGHGGGRASVRQTHARLLSGRYPFVFRTDIRGYYARISKTLLYEQLCRYVSSPVLRDLLCQFLHYSVEDGGEFHTPLRGIPRGSALSPLLAAFHLTETDNVFSRNRHVTYARYMDDFLILSPTRWHLRRAVRMLNRHFAQAGFEQHPDKTFIGRVEKGFDWMGFWFTEKGCDGVAPRALQNFTDRLRRLYERVRQWPEDLRLRRMAGYVRAWRRWSSFAQMGSVQTCGTDVAGDVVDLCHVGVVRVAVALVVRIRCTRPIVNEIGVRQIPLRCLAQLQADTELYRVRRTVLGCRAVVRPVPLCGGTAASIDEHERRRQRRTQMVPAYSYVVQGFLCQRCSASD
ncbi:transposase [Salmonella enterica]|nr:transposase [Salmonella enterica]ELW3426735.1 transposase [Salmonella enterica]